MIPCDCCGRPNPDTRWGGGGLIHFHCWDEHHSDPTGVWPPEHICDKETR